MQSNALYAYSDGPLTSNNWNIHFDGALVHEATASDCSYCASPISSLPDEYMFDWLTDQVLPSRSVAL